MAIEIVPISDTMVGNRTIEQIECEIIILRDQAAQNMIEIGKRLTEAKGMIPYGEWQAWLENNVQFSYRTAARLMQAAAQFGDMPSVSHLPISKIYALLDVPADKLDEFVDAHNITDMSTRQLQAAIKAQNDAEERARAAEQAAQQATEDADALRGQLKTEWAAAETDRLKQIRNELIISRNTESELRQRIRDLESSSAETPDVADLRAQLQHAIADNMEKQSALQDALRESQTRAEQAVDAAKSKIREHSTTIAMGAMYLRGIAARDAVVRMTHYTQKELYDFTDMDPTDRKMIILDWIARQCKMHMGGCGNECDFDYGKKIRYSTDLWMGQEIELTAIELYRLIDDAIAGV